MLFQARIAVALDGTGLSGFVQNIDELLIVVLFLFGVFDVLAARDRLRIDGEIMAIAGFFIFGLVSALRERVPLQVAFEGFFLLAKGFMLYFALVRLRFEHEEYRKLLRLFLGLGLVFFFFGILDFLDPSGFRTMTKMFVDVDYRAGLPSVISLFIHPGEFGWWMAFLYLFVLASSVVYRNVNALMLMGVFLLGAVASFRAKALMAIALGSVLGIQYLFRQKVERKQIVFLLLPVALIASFFLVALPKISEVMGRQYTQYVDQASSVEEVPRNLLYAVGFELARDHFPLGVGFGRYGGWTAFKYYSPHYYSHGFSMVYGLAPDSPTLYATDTFWPMIVGEAGYIGLAAYVIACLYWLRMALIVMARSEHDFERFMALATFFVLVQALIESSATPVFARSPSQFFVFAALAYTRNVYHGELLAEPA